MTRGRPRKFDRDRALDSAMLTFWRRGYQATSLDDLTKAMGINRPSLYGTFGDKEQLFLQALERYAEQYGGRVVAVLNGEFNARSAVEAFLNAVVTQLSDPTLPVGCLRVNSTLESNGLSETIYRTLINHQAHLESVLYERLRRGQAEGQLSTQEDVQALAWFFAGVVNGMVVRAQVHADPRTLQQMARIALHVWPT